MRRITDLLAVSCLRGTVLVAVFVAACGKPAPKQPPTDSGLAAASASQERGAVTRTSNESFRQVSKIPQMIACGPAHGTTCFVDSTRARDECCTGDVIADWILVVARSDSLEFFVGPGSGARRADAGITMQQIGRGRAFQEHDINTASYLRYRFPEPGAYTLHVGVPPRGSDTTAYELRVRQTGHDPATDSLRGAPLVFLDADSTARLAIVPDRRTAAARGDLSAFEVRAGWYRLLAPGLDSVFVCRLPCGDLRSVPLSARERSLRF